MRAFLLIILVLLPTAAQAQLNFFGANPTLNSNKSPNLSPAAYTAFGYATDYVRTEMACRHTLPLEERGELIQAATRVYLAAGFNLEGAGTALRELERSLGSRPSWARQKCATRFSRFLEYREHELRVVVDLTAPGPEN